MSFQHALAALALAFAAVAGIAQSGDSTIEGTIVDAATKKPVSDAIVTATSPSLSGERTAVTDAQGDYGIAKLPPGGYTLRVETDGYRPYSRGGIDLKLDRTIRVNVELLPESVTER